jgi:hypothetical protein
MFVFSSAADSSAIRASFSARFFAFFSNAVISSPSSSASEDAASEDPEPNSSSTARSLPLSSSLDFAPMLEIKTCGQVVLDALRLGLS